LQVAVLCHVKSDIDQDGRGGFELQAVHAVHAVRFQNNVQKIESAATWAPQKACKAPKATATGDPHRDGTNITLLVPGLANGVEQAIQKACRSVVLRTT
jgi:hypothetical protein